MEGRLNSNSLSVGKLIVSDRTKLHYTHYTFETVEIFEELLAFILGERSYITRAVDKMVVIVRTEGIYSLPHSSRLTRSV